MAKLDITSRYFFQAPKNMLYCAVDYSSQEMRVAAASAKISKLIALYKLEREYDYNLRDKPKDPEGNEYNDPLIDPHILAGMFTSAEVKRIVEETPWLATKKHPVVGPARQQGKIINFCVPLDTQALTRSGWKNYDQLIIGEEILAYDKTSDTNIWTPLREITVIPNQKVFNLKGGQNWSAFATGNHRWIGKKRRDGGSKGKYEEYREFTTDEINSEYSILNTAVAEGGDLLLSKEDAARIAWIITDGHIKWAPSIGIKSGKRFVQARVSQTKEEYKLVIENLFRGLYTNKATREDGNCTWLLKANEVRDLWSRAKLNIDNPDWLVFVISLSKEARRAFLESVWQAEGDVIIKCGTKRIAQNEGTLLDAIILASYLEGFNPSITKGCGNKFNNKLCRRVLLRTKRYITCQRLRKTSVGLQDVWCPTTDLGTWVMKQGDMITLGGNCTIYGGSASKIAEEVGCSTEEAGQMLKAYFGPDGFWELDVWIKSMGNLAKAQRWVKTAAGNMIFNNEANAKGLEDANTVARRSVNSLIQGLSSTISKLGLVYTSAKLEELDSKYYKHTGVYSELLGITHDRFCCA